MRFRAFWRWGLLLGLLGLMGVLPARAAEERPPGVERPPGTTGTPGNSPDRSFDKSAPFEPRMDSLRGSGSGGSSLPEEEITRQKQQPEEMERQRRQEEMKSRQKMRSLEQRQREAPPAKSMDVTKPPSTTGTPGNQPEGESKP